MLESPSTSLPPEIATLLTTLRGRIRRYVLWEGLALVVVLVGLLFWGSFVIDTLYFVASRLEIPRVLRAAFLVFMFAALMTVVLIFIGFRVFRAFRSRALALVLERRFPELRDSLITAVEAAEGSLRHSPGVHQAMLERTLRDAARRLERVDLGQVLDPRPVRRAAIFAAALFASIIGLTVVDTAAMERWVSGYLELRPTYWPRETILQVKVLTQPGDRIREFQHGVYRHPRGGDLTLLVEVPHGKKRPERVRLDYRLRGGSLKRVWLISGEGQPFLQALPALLDSVDLWVSGGDYASFSPLRVQVVEPPRIDRLVADGVFPEYTGLNAHDDRGDVLRTETPVIGASVSLPLGADLMLRGISNKPLQSVRLELEAGAERFDIEFTAETPTSDLTAGPAVSATVTRRARDGVPQSKAIWAAGFAEQALDGGGREFAVPLLLVDDGGEQLTTAVTAAAKGGPPLPTRLPWPADALIRITLEDRDGISSPEPTRVTLAGIVDQPPTLEVELRGISSSVTRQARIPVAGTIRDDYGLGKVRFEYQIDVAGEWKSQELVRPPQRGAKEFELARSDSEAFERFDVLPLDLSVKQKLALTIYAEDTKNIQGPNHQRSQKFIFTVVPVEELLSQLYARELNLRKRFEQILSELKDLQKDLDLHHGRAEQAAKRQQGGKTDADDELRQWLLGIAACSDRSLLGVRKAATETAAIETAFRDIRDELVNNAAETPQNMDRLETKILAPLSRVNASDYPALDQALGLFRLATEQGRGAAGEIDASRLQLAGLIDRLEQILLEMKKLETFNEVVELLKSLMNGHIEVMDETKTERKRNALRSLE